VGETISPIALEDNQDVGSFQRHSEPAAKCCFACSSRPGGIFSGLDQPSLVELDRLRQTSTYPAGFLVYSEADRPRAAYCVCSGRLKLSCSSPDGRSVILGIAASGDVLGVRQLLLGSLHDHTAETLEESLICLVPKDTLLSFMKRNPDVSLKLSQKLSRELGQAYRQVRSLVFKPAAERLAEVLLALCRTHGQPVPGGIGLKTNMGQDEMAEMVGLSRRSLNRALGTLRGQGLIECGRRFIIVRNHAALENCLI
jgi:CRP/FNR family transcriptional regulator